MKMKSNSKRRIGLTYLIFMAVIVISFAAVRATKAAEEPVRLEPPARIIFRSA